MDDRQGEVPRRKKNKKKEKQSRYIWGVKVFFVSLFSTGILSLITGESMNSLPVVVAFVLLALFILINILFDIIGLAVATAAESPFHSMAARKNKVGKTAVLLLKNADKVTSICADIIGDIAGVVSGATSTAIAAKIYISDSVNFWISLTLTSAVAALIVGGKAFSKKIAIDNSVKIVMFVSRILCFFISDKKKKRK